jgi:hypothetical protein
MDDCPDRFHTPPPYLENSQKASHAF